MSEQELENRIQELGLTAPRVTPEHIDSMIVKETYTVLPSKKVMVCELTLTNGFTVRGEGAAVSPENFNEEIGRRVSRENARDKIWELEGYLLQQRLHEEKITGKQIARVCHEVNRAYCQALGDDSQPAWDDAPEWQRHSAMLGVAMHLGNPDAGPQASHEGWMAHKLSEGWVYGEEKDPENKTHPCLVPFHELPVSQQAKDYIFRAVVHALADTFIDGDK